MLFKEKNHSLLPELWIDKGNTPSKLPSFSRVRCKHLSITPMKPLQSGPGPLPALLSYHHCLPCPHTPAPLHSAQSSKKPSSHFSLWHMLSSNQHLYPYLLDKTPLLSQNTAQMFSFMEGHPWAVPFHPTLLPILLFINI